MKTSFLVLFLIVAGCSSSNKKKDQRIFLEDESESPRYFIISEPTRNDGKELGRDLFLSTVKIADGILESLTENQKLIFLGQKKNFEILQERIKSKKLENLVLIESAPYFWLQDLFEVFRDPHGSYVLGVPHGNRSLVAPVELIAKAFGGKVQIIAQPENKAVAGQDKAFVVGAAVHGVTGGNLEKWTSKVGFIGLSDFLDREHALSFANSIFTPDVQREVLPTQWLYLGHVDEVVKPLKYENLQNKNCQITALIASPLKAIELISKNPEEYIYDAKSLGKRKLTDIYVMKDLCRDLEIKNCKNLKWKDILKNPHYEEKFLSTQGLVAKELDSLKSLVFKTINKTQTCQIDWIEAPHLYVAEQTPEKKLKRRSATPLFPNPTNGLVVGQSYVFLDPATKLFRNDLNRILKNINLEPKIIEAAEQLHRGGRADGYIHCMTQVLR